MESGGKRTVASRPPNPATSGAFPRQLLHGTYAALRCRELVERGLFAAARFEYDALRHALRVLDNATPDTSTKREIDFLRLQERKLGETIRAWQCRETR